MRYIRKIAEIIGYLTCLIIALVSSLLYFTSDDRKAQSEGFESASDKHAALSAGVNDAKAWRENRAAEKARADQEIQAETLKKQEADRAARAAADALATEQKASEAKAAAQKHEDCKKDLKCWAEKGTIAASVYCSTRIERLAQYSMKWTDAWYESKFSHYRWSRSYPREKGVVTYLGDKAQFQNGFSAFQNVVYTCDMIPDDADHTVYDVSVEPGRLN